VKGTIISAGGIHNLKNYEGEAKEIILVCDHDKPGSPAHKTITDTKQHFEEKGLIVHTLMPKTLGHEFNDVLKEQGVDGVRVYVKDFLEEKSTSKSLSPEKGSRSLERDQ
jgi:DNA primase